MTKIPDNFGSHMNGWKFLILCFLFWFGFLALTGTLTSGFHFTDDHDILRIEKEVSESNVGKEVGIFINEIFSSKQRFRPLHALQRRVGAAVFGTDWTVWSVYFGVLAVFTSFFLFLFMRELRFSVVESVLFAGLTLLGEQAAVWWKLGTNETLGMFWLALALLFMAKSTFETNKGKKLKFTLVFIVSAGLASWCKESFILVLPALALGKTWLTAYYGERIQNETVIAIWKRAVKENIWTVVILLAVFIAEILHVIIKVGTTTITYAGYEGFSIPVFLRTAFYSFMAVHGWIIILLLLVLGGLYFFNAGTKEQSETKRVDRPWVFFVGVLLFGGLMAGPQVVLYMKSGIQERYLLPGIMGYTFLMVALLRYIRLKWDARRFIVIGLTVLLAAVCLQQLRVTRYTAMAFSRDGEYTTGWLHSIEQNAKQGDMIYVITHPFKHLEPSFALRKYLKYGQNQENVRFAPPEMTIPKSKLWRLLNRDAPKAVPNEKVQIFLIFPHLEKDFIKKNSNWFNPHSYKVYKNDRGYVTYTKKQPPRPQAFIKRFAGGPGAVTDGLYRLPLPGGPLAAGGI